MADIKFLDFPLTQDGALYLFRSMLVWGALLWASPRLAGAVLCFLGGMGMVVWWIN